jgi:hypothetical protein
MIRFPQQDQPRIGSDPIVRRRNLDRAVETWGKQVSLLFTHCVISWFFMVGLEHTMKHWESRKVLSLSAVTGE